MIPVTDAYPALLRLTLRCLTCHGGVGVLLGCIFFFFSPFFFFFWLSVHSGLLYTIYSISIAYSFFFFSFFPPFFFCSFGCVQSGLLDYIGLFFFFLPFLFSPLSFFSFGCVHLGLLQVDNYRLIFFPFLLGVFIRGCNKCRLILPSAEFAVPLYTIAILFPFT